MIKLNSSEAVEHYSMKIYVKTYRLREKRTRKRIHKYKKNFEISNKILLFRLMQVKILLSNL